MFSYYLRFLIKDPVSTIITNINTMAAKCGIKLLDFKKISDLINVDNPSIVVMTDKIPERLMNLFLLELQSNYSFTDDSIVKLRISDHGH
jgi:hypothetical protein